MVEARDGSGNGECYAVGFGVGGRSGGYDGGIGEVCGVVYD